MTRTFAVWTVVVVLGGGQAPDRQSAATTEQIRGAIADLAAPKEYVRQRQAAERLAKLGPAAEPAAAALITVIAQPVETVGGDVMDPVPGFEEAVEAAKQAVRKIGPAAVPALIDALAKPSAGSHHIVELLAATNDPRVLPSLVGALGGHVDWRVQLTLIEMTTPGVDDAVAARLDDPNERVRRAAMLTLVGRKDQRALSHVEALLATAEPYQRWEAVGYLATLQPPDVRERLHALLEDADALVRSEAAARLGSVGDRRDVSILIPILRDRHARVRWGAAFALGKLGDERAIAPLQDAIKTETEGSSRQAMEDAVRMINPK